MNATAKQIDFIKSLCAKTGYDPYFKAKYPTKIEPPDYNTGMFAKEAQK